MNFILGMMYLQSIQMTFPGGVQQFQADGGDVSVASLPGAPEEVYVCHPSLPSEVRTVLEKVTEELGKKLHINIHFVDQPNFGGRIDEETIRNVQKSMTGEPIGEETPPKLSASLSTALAIFLVLNKHKDDPIIDELVQRALAVEGLVRGFIICDDGFVRLEQGSEKAKLNIQRPQRDNVIGQDDVTNLRIALGEDKDVNDIIEGL